MFKNYLKIAARNIVKYKIHSAIHIFGFSAALSIVILLFLYVKLELSADKFHENYKNIYRLQTTKNSGLSPQFAEVLQQTIPGIERVTRIISAPRMVLNYDKPLYVTNIISVDQTFFDIFSFQTIQGDLQSALNEPASIVLTKTEAERLFGKQNPLGKTVQFANEQFLTVTAVIKNIPKNSSIQFNGVVPIQFLDQVFGNVSNKLESTNFEHYFLSYEKLNTKEIGKNIKRHFNERYPGWHLDQEYDVIQFSKIHFDHSVQDRCKHGNGSELILLVGIGLLILIVAIINFINLSIAKSSKRFLEIGVRKVIGASRGMLIGQFLTEAVIICLIAIGFSLFLVNLFAPEFNVIFKTDLSLKMIATPVPLFSILLTGITLGLIAGIYPGFYVTAFHPTQVIKGEKIIGGRTGLFKKGLLVFQFVISVVLIICTLVIGKQRSFLHNRNLGFNPKNSLILNHTTNMSGSFKQELLQYPNIKKLSISNGIPGHGYNATDTQWKYKGQIKDIRFLFSNVDEHFLPLLEFNLTEGRFFSRETDNRNPVCIINETAKKDFEINNINEAYFDIFRDTGEQSNPAQVIGIVQDFNQESLHNMIQPFVFFYQPELGSGYPILKIISDNNQILQQTMNQIEKLWGKYYPNTPFQYHFLDDRLDNIYEQEKNFERIFITFSALSLVIAGLGLLGLVSFITEQRTKEIGIRKVFGASMTNIIGMLTKDFMKWVIFASLIAWPIAWYGMNQWLQNYAYKTEIGFDLFLYSEILVCGISIFTVYFQALRTATANPAKALRHE